MSNQQHTNSIANEQQHPNNAARSHKYASNIVIDLEWTAVPKQARRNGLRYEIIEIGAVRVLPDGTVADEFRSLVCPEFSSRISACVRNLTGIRDCDVCDAEPFAVVLERFFEWVGQEPVRFVAWSNSDQIQIQNECFAKGIVIPEQFSRWMDLQRVYPRLLHVAKSRGRMALSEAAEWCGAPLDPNSAHRALYDAQVTASLLTQILTGEHIEQRTIVSQILQREEQERSCTVNLGSSCSGLAALLSQLQANEKAA